MKLTCQFKLLVNNHDVTVYINLIQCISSPAIIVHVNLLSLITSAFTFVGLFVCLLTRLLKKVVDRFA